MMYDIGYANGTYTIYEVFAIEGMTDALKEAKGVHEMLRSFGANKGHVFIEDNDMEQVASFPLAQETDKLHF